MMDRLGNISAFMNKCEIRGIELASAQFPELLAGKPKCCLRDGIRNLLFNADDRGAGEDWAEGIAC